MSTDTDKEQDTPDTEKPVMDDAAIGDALASIRQMITEGGEPEDPDFDAIPDDDAEEALLLTDVIEEDDAEALADRQLTIERAVAELSAKIDAKEQSAGQLLEALLEPMLREWLDQNLEPLIVRTVREELRKRQIESDS